MPSSITHAYIVKDVYERLDKNIKLKVSSDYLESLKTYAQGFDILYFYKILNPFQGKEIREFGSFVHNEKVVDYLVNVTKKVKLSKNIEEFAFLIGLITHFVADFTMHPFINYQANLLVKKHFNLHDSHFVMETYLDNYMIKNREKGLYTKFKIYDFCFNLNNQTIMELLNNSFKEVYNKENIGNYYFEALKDMKNFFKYLRYDTTRLKWYFYQISNLISKFVFRDVRYLSYNFPLQNDEFYLNLNHKKWYNLNNMKIESDESFLDLYEKVITKSKLIIKEVFDYVFLAKDLDLNLFYQTNFK